MLAIALSRAISTGVQLPQPQAIFAGKLPGAAHDSHTPNIIRRLFVTAPALQRTTIASKTRVNALMAKKRCAALRPGNEVTPPRLSL
jgi:hypothetical protein